MKIILKGCDRCALLPPYVNSIVEASANLRAHPALTQYTVVVSAATIVSQPLITDDLIHTGYTGSNFLSEQYRIETDGSN